MNIFFEIKELQRPPFHPKWREVALNAPLPGWTRFAPAQTWLDRNATVASDTRQKFDAFMAAQARDNGRQETPAANDDAALYQQFLNWKANQPGTRR